MRQNLNSEAGFTLIELLTIVAIIWVLTTVALQSYTMYQKKAFDSSADQMLNQVKIALESGRIENSLTDPPDWRFATLTEPGPIADPEISEFLPGLIVHNYIELSVERNGICELGEIGDGCITEWIQVRHCKGESVKSWWRFRDGTEQRAEWLAEGFPPC